jgi:hypothetical protein
VFRVIPGGTTVTVVVALVSSSADADAAVTTVVPAASGSNATPPEATAPAERAWPAAIVTVPLCAGPAANTSRPAAAVPLARVTATVWPGRTACSVATYAFAPPGTPMRTWNGSSGEIDVGVGPRAAMSIPGVTTRTFVAVALVWPGAEIARVAVPAWFSTPWR